MRFYRYVDKELLEWESLRAFWEKVVGGDGGQKGTSQATQTSSWERAFLAL